MTTSVATLDVTAVSEKAIRDLAATVINHAKARLDHPSYGYTKGGIRAIGSQMEGAIGVYMVLTGQAAHPQVSNLADFTDPYTDNLVGQARLVVDSL